MQSAEDRVADYAVEVAGPGVVEAGAA